MAVDPVPYFVGNPGAQHSAEVVRSSMYAATRGAEGIAGVADLKVQAQSVPNGTVQVVPGGALLLNRYPGGSGQSYTLRNATATDVPITATGSGGGRTDLIVARILDSQYEGTPPVDPNDFQYSRIVTIQGVPSGTKTARELNLGYPAIALAKITLPASTGTVTDAMITDLRRVAQPRRERAMVTVFPTASIQVPTAAYGPWPINTPQQPQVYVPEWATRVDIVAHMSGVKYAKGDGAADSVAGIRTSFAGVLNVENGILVQDAADSGNRYSYTLIGTHLISAAQRDTTVALGLHGVRSGGTGLWWADNQTSVVIDWEFSEGAQ